MSSLWHLPDDASNFNHILVAADFLDRPYFQNETFFHSWEHLHVLRDHRPTKGATLSNYLSSGIQQLIYSKLTSIESMKQLNQIPALINPVPVIVPVIVEFMISPFELLLIRNR